MNLIDNIKQKVKLNKKTIVLPETMDERILKAAEKVLTEEFAEIILIGDKKEIEKRGYNLKKATFINPNNSSITEKFITDLEKLRRHKGMTYDKAKDLLLNDYMYFACMLVYNNMADGIVSGACHSTSNTLRPALEIIKTHENSKLVSAFFLINVPNCDYGLNGTFVFADSGLVQNPTMEELAYIAADSAESFHLLTGETPYIAMLSHSTKGSASHPLVDKVIKATNLAKNLTSYNIDGELQLDAAIVPEVAKIKAPNSNVAGKANVLIFPNLDSGNIGYKLVQRLAKAEAYGPITQGIKSPVNDLSRGCTVEDIVGVIAITALQCEKK